MSDRKRSGSTSSSRPPKKKAAAPDNQKRLDLFFPPKSVDSKPNNDNRHELDDVTNQSPQQISLGSDDDLERDTDSPKVMLSMDNNDQGLEELAVYKSSMYTDQFHEMLSVVLNDEHFLFTASEIKLLDEIQHLEDESLHLFVRLWMRKYGWIRLDKLDYRNHVRDAYQSAAVLCDAGLVSDTINDPSEALALLPLDELKALADECGVQPGKGTKNRSDYSRALAMYGNRKKKEVWLERIRKCMGAVVKIKPHVSELLRRVHLVYFRLTEDTQQSNPMTSAIMSRINKWTFPDYIPCRTSCVWLSRDELLAYEEALAIRRSFDEKLESIAIKRRRQKSRGPEFADWERSVLTDCWSVCENIIGIWDQIIQRASHDDARPYYMRRFEAGWVYTHMIEHGTDVLAKLHEHTLEATMLRKLLDQYIYRLGKRGAWYDRLALVETNHLQDKSDREMRKQALKTCIRAIQDPRVHQIYLKKLYRRITRLERALCIPRREQHDFSYIPNKKPEERAIYGERISDFITGQKSIWRGNDGAERTVEELAIEYYEKQGFKGLHSEGGIITMIFIFLFWDILFAPMPAVFETAYQTAPLDLWTDAFYVGRAGMINQRLGEIGQGKFLDLMKTVDARERPRRTLCAGVNWVYEAVDLLQVAECIGGAALSSLCRLLAEEFGHRRGGMPDLCCWNFEEKTCIFVEVKGPGDKLSETQKLWIDTLSTFDIAVEVCYVKVWEGEDVLLQESQ